MFYKQHRNGWQKVGPHSAQQHRAEGSQPPENPRRSLSC